MGPIITTTVSDTRQAVAGARGQGKTIGLVPTMGALHEGHMSLVRTARTECGYVVVSVFVNPTQFGPSEDLARYPRPFEKDVALCAAEGTDLIFQPQPQTMYPSGFRTYVEVHGFQDVLCGASRPGHFRGVATVVLKLFHIVQPDIAYFGQKDAQQARLLEQMVRDLDVPVTLKVCPIVREADGLAMSSRNRYLSPDERKNATVLHRALEATRRRVESGERQSAPLVTLIADMVARTPGAKLDYASVVDLETLEPLNILKGRVLVALAVFFGSTRLIDNVILSV